MMPNPEHNHHNEDTEDCTHCEAIRLYRELTKVIIGYSDTLGSPHVGMVLDLLKGEILQAGKSALGFDEGEDEDAHAGLIGAPILAKHHLEDMKKSRIIECPDCKGREANAVTKGDRSDCLCSACDCAWTKHKDYRTEASPQSFCPKCGKIADHLIDGNGPDEPLCGVCENKKCDTKVWEIE